MTVAHHQRDITKKLLSNNEKIRHTLFFLLGQITRTRMYTFDHIKCYSPNILISLMGQRGVQLQGVSCQNGLLSMFITKRHVKWVYFHLPST